MSAETDKFDASLELLGRQCRFTGYVYALTDVQNAITEYVQANGTTVMEIHDVLDICSRLSERAQEGGNYIEARGA